MSGTRRAACSIPRARLWSSPDHTPMRSWECGMRSRERGMWRMRTDQSAIRIPQSEILMIRAVCFDVDFTLIYPGPMFRGEGYRAFCARYGMTADPAKFDAAVASAASILDDCDNAAYDAEIFVRYTRHIIEEMGGRGDRIDECAREIYAEWALCQHFDLYDEVADALRELSRAGLRLGLISNSHRCLASFQSHFELQG